MELTTVWFVLIAVLWSGYFVLEGFDFGVGMLLPFVGKTEGERRAILTTLGPVWDGNEVWLLVAGGATFAAFPEWYATMFSGFYLPLLIILIALIIRGVAFANLVRGVPLKMASAGNVLYDCGFFNQLNPYALLGCLTTLTLFLAHGSTFLSLKTRGAIRERAAKLSTGLGLVAAVFAVAFLLWTQLAYSDKTLTWILVGVAAIAWLIGIGMHFIGKDGWAFLFSAITLVSAVAFLFWVLVPNVMPGSNDPALSLTVINAASSPYTLKVMTVVALVFTPLVLAYQAWTYWVFRKRVGPENIADPAAGSLDLPHEVKASTNVG